MLRIPITPVNLRGDRVGFLGGFLVKFLYFTARDFVCLFLSI